MDNDVHRLVSELGAAMAAAGSDLDNLERAAQEIADDDKPLRLFLESVVFDSEAAAAIAADSYWHAHGFAKINLHRNHAPEFRIRLHVWPDGSPDAPVFEYANAHNHRWDFASVVLAGALRIEEFEETPDFYDEKAIPCRRFTYSTPPGVRSGALAPEGLALLKPIARPCYQPWELYCSGMERPHVVSAVSGRFCATAVLQGPARAQESHVYQPLQREPVADTNRPLTTDELVDLVTMTLASIE